MPLFRVHCRLPPSPLPLVVQVVAAAAARAVGPTPDLTAGSHRLAELLIEDESDNPAAGLKPGDSSRKGSSVLSVPKEIWRLVDALYRR